MELRHLQSFSLTEVVTLGDEDKDVPTYEIF